METLTLPILAVVAGVLSFSSPCCLPLLPGYLSYVSALPVSELGERQARGVTLRASLLFVAGFTTVFTILGVGAALLGSVFLRNQTTLERVFGVVIIALGLSTLGVLRLPFLQRERRLDLTRVPQGPAWAFPLGMAFAAGWAPCIGPVLATILATAAVSGGSAVWGGAAAGALLGRPRAPRSCCWAWGSTRPPARRRGCGATGARSRSWAACCWWPWGCCSSPASGATCSCPSSGGSPGWGGRRYDRP